MTAAAVRNPEPQTTQDFRVRNIPVRSLRVGKRMRPLGDMYLFRIGPSVGLFGKEEHSADTPHVALPS